MTTQPTIPAHLRAASVPPRAAEDLTTANPGTLRVERINDSAFELLLTTSSYEDAELVVSLLSGPDDVDQLAHDLRLEGLALLSDDPLDTPTLDRATYAVVRLP